MKILPYHFRGLRIAGLIRDRNDKFLIFKKFYVNLVALLLLYLFLGEMTELFKAASTVEEATEILFIGSYAALFIIKIFNASLRQDLLLSIESDLHQEVCRPVTVAEQQLYGKYERLARNIFFTLYSFATACVLVELSVPFLIKKYDQLPYKVYNFLNLPESIFFNVTYVAQILVAILGTFLNSVLDNTIYGLFIVIAGQMDMLSHRFAGITASKGCDELINRCIKHHLFLQNLVLKIQRSFLAVITLFFLECLVILCSSIFQLSQLKIGTPEFISVLMYLGFILSHSYLHCWFGNDINIKSQSLAQSIYLSDWYLLNSKQRMKLLMISRQAQKGLCISFHGQVSMSIETFGWLIKKSYAAFNLLHQSV